MVRIDREYPVTGAGVTEATDMVLEVRRRRVFVHIIGTRVQSTRSPVAASVLPSTPYTVSRLLLALGVMSWMSIF